MRYCRLPSWLRGKVLLFAMELRDLKMQFALRLLRFVSYVLCVSALGAGLYVRWFYNDQNAWILGMAIVTLTIFLIAVALRYYFSFVAVEEVLGSVCLTFLLGFISLTSASVPEDEGTEQIMNYLLLGSAGFRLLSLLLGKGAVAVGVCHSEETAAETGKLLPSRVAWTLTGMAVAVVSVASVGKGSLELVLSLQTLLAALTVTLCAMRLGSRLSVLLLALHLSASYFLVLRPLHVPFNTYTLAYFLADLFLDGLIDLVVFGGDDLGRWRPVTGASRHLLRLLLVVAFAFQLGYVTIAAMSVPKHKEWVVIVFIYAAGTVLFWGPFRAALLVTGWQLVNRLNDCHLVYERVRSGSDRSVSGSFADVMAAKGVRHFALVCTRVVGVAVITSVIPLLVTWTAASPLAVSLFLLVLPYECTVFSFLRLLGDRLGGTCCGHAIIGSPVPDMYRNGGGITLLSPDEVEKMASRSGAILGLVHKFFTHHMIDNSGCDCSTGAVTMDYVGTKLKDFFSKRSAEGRKFDTYLLYYSGSVHPSGDWALAGSGTLKYDDLLKAWCESEVSNTSRLIVILDTLRSSSWLSNVKKTRGAYIGLQTATMDSDMEALCSASIGDFTRDWVNFNCGTDNSIYGDTYVSPIRVTYSVSRQWASFKFSTPTREEVGRYWDASFPKAMKPLKLIVNFPSLDSLACCCIAVWNWLLNCKMSLFLPARLDTGHGFKLVRFFRMR